MGPMPNARQCQPRMFLRCGLDPRYALGVAQVVLRHGLVPTEVARKHRGGANSHCHLKFFAGQC